MSSKRPREEVSDEGGGEIDSRNKKPRHGFRVGPENLPDGPWRRKGTAEPRLPEITVLINTETVTKIKKNLITKAKVKKQYAKVKAEFQQHQQYIPAIPVPAEELEPTSAINPPPQDVGNGKGEPGQDHNPQIHPDRQAMLDTDPNPNPSTDAQPGPPRERRRRNRPDYFAKELAAAERAKAAAEARAAEAQRREEEKKRRIAERERYRKAMAKAKAPGRDGKRKLGRESGILLDRVKRIVGES